MAELLTGKVAIVTGSGRGIGAAAAKLLAREGARVVVSDLDPDPTETVTQAIKANGGEAIGVPGDVTDPAFPEALMKAAVDAFGHIDVLVNNAGYTWDGMLHKMTDEQIGRFRDVHVQRLGLHREREAERLRQGK